MRKKRIFCAAASVLMLVTGLAACGPKKAANTETDIELLYWSSGSGVEFLEKTIAAFEKEFPQYNVDYTENHVQDAITNTFGLGEKYDTIDLYMSSAKMLLPEDLEEHAEPLNGVLEYTAEGEGKTVGEKFNAEVLGCLKHADGKYYNLPYQGGWLGLVYNKSIVNGQGALKVPNTTAELETLVMALGSAKAFQHFEYGGYWRFVYSVWQAQYDGMDYINNVFNPLDDPDDDTDEPAKSVLLKKDGRYKAMQVLERIVTPQTVTADSNSEKFTTAQTKFLNGSAAMMPTGSWLMNEMRSSPDKASNFLMMRVPVISDIIYQCEEIDDDAELSALIAAVDAATRAEDVPVSGAGYSVSENDVKRVFEARNIMASTMAENSFIVPNYSVAKQAAIEFVKFYYRDAVLVESLQTNKQPVPLELANPSLLDTSSWTEWDVQQYNWAKTAIPWFEEAPTRSPLFTKGGANPYAGVDIITSMCNTHKVQGADALFAEMEKRFNRDWDGYVLNSK